MLTKTPQLPAQLFAFIKHFLLKHKRVTAAWIILPIIAGFWGPFNSIIIKHLFDLLPSAINGDTSMLLLPAGLVVVNFIIFDNFTWRSIYYLRAKYIPIIQNDIIAKMMDLALSHSHGFYQNNLSGKISKQITSLVDGITAIITRTSANLLRGSSLLIISFIASYSVNPVFCAILIIWFAFFATASLFMSKRLVAFSDHQASEESIVVGELVDSLSNHHNVRIFASRDYEIKRMFPYFEGQRKAYTKTYMYSTLLSSIQGALIATMMAFSAYFLVYLYGKGAVSVGDFALILGLCMETGHMMWFTMSEVDEFNKAVGRCRQSLNALIVPLEVSDIKGSKNLICSKGAIFFNKVKFHYKGSSPLFADLSVTIPAGQRVGLVGYSGGGKTTFVNLIMRLYDITSGTIEIDGHDISKVTQESLRQFIAMIPQDPTLFNRTLMENIRYGNLTATDKQVIAAAKKAHAHEFISKLANGYDSLVGERGVKLSGGQRQRIAIARAILKNAPLLILDEATSQLDSVTERLIQESLWGLMQNKTTIVIAHRLSTLLHMDRILVFDKGKIVEDGTHIELLAQNGLYKKLWDSQVGGFLGDDQPTL